MECERPHIHLFTTPGGYYIFDVNTNLILKTNESVYNLLRNNNTAGAQGNAEVLQMIENMKVNGYLSSNKVSEIVHPADRMLEHYLNNKLRAITLQITQQCNFRCEYCIFSGHYSNRSHTDKKMDFEMAKKGIDFLIAHSRDSETVSIGFYGGEPLLEFDTIKKCIEYATHNAEGKRIEYTLTTNGSLLNERITAFLEANKVSLLISLDGPKEIHDKNRKFAGSGCGTFDKVMENLEKIRKKFPQYFKKIGFSVVIDPQIDFSCVNKFFTSYDMVKDLKKLPSFISMNYAKNEVHASEEFTVSRNYEIFKVLLYKIKKLDQKYISALVLNYYDNLKRYLYDNRKPTPKLFDKEHHGGPCIPGAQRLFMNIYGDLFPCERVSEESGPMKIGHIDTGFNIEKCRDLLNIGKLTRESCQNCWALRFCTMCGAFADNLESLSGETKKPQCGSVRTNTEGLFKDYCALKEFGCDFDDEVDFKNGLNFIANEL